MYFGDRRDLILPLNSVRPRCEAGKVAHLKLHLEYLLSVVPIRENHYSKTLLSELVGLAKTMAATIKA